ncbi:MAG TPA: AAA family ATPase [Candidatus Thermoplasmatota archaeon]|nr:AAA family ATPase [Candidatus Thermoplasmatota archaeon]
MGSVIEDELFSSSVIKELRMLDFDFVPPELPHRIEQLKKLASMFKPLLSGLPQHVFIHGPVGTGKTAMTKHFCQSLVSIARKQGVMIEYVHINCRKRSTDSLVLLGILAHFDPRFPDRGFSVQEMLQILRTHLQRREAQLLLALDEVDALLKKNGSNLLYNLTRFNDESTKQSNPVSVIMVSQKDAFSMIDTATLSTFKRGNTIALEKYTRGELYDIVKQRVELAFYPRTVPGESIDLIADIAGESGDARFAIELLWKAGLFADEQRQKQVCPEHVRAAKAETYSVVTESKLRALGRHQLLVLLSIAKRLQKDGTAYTDTGEAEKTYAITCEEYQEKPRAHTQFWEYLKEIEHAGFLNMKQARKGQLGVTQIISLPDIPAGVLREKLENLLA